MFPVKRYVHLSALIMSCSLAFSSMSLVASPVATVSAATTTAIALTSTSNVQVKSASLFSQEKGLYLMYTLTYTNKGSTALQLGDYWSKVKSLSGSTYPTKIIAKDKTVTTVAPKSSVDLTFYAEVGEQATLNNLAINIVKWDFSQPDYTRGLGTFNLSRGFGAPAQAFLPNYLNTKENKIKTAIKSVQSSVNGDYRTVNISFLMENLNSREYKAGTTSFYLTTATGAVYTVKSDGLKDVVIMPGERKIVTIQATLPTSVKEDGNKLFMGYASEADGIYIPQATYQVPKWKGITNVSVSQLSYGNYTIELLGYDRLPNGPQDILVAKLKVTNKITSAVKVPTLKATWDVNGITQTSTTPNVVAYDSRLQIEPGKSIQLAANLAVPYTAQLENVKVSLNEVVDPQTENTVGQLSNSSINQISTSQDKSVQFTRIGSNAKVELLRVRASEENKQLNVIGDLAITNLEVRSTNLQKYAIYLQGANGQLYPLAVAEYKKAVIPNGRIVIPFSGKVPLMDQTGTLKVLVAELIPYDSANAQSPSIPIEVAGIDSTWPQNNGINSFANLSIGKYDFTFDKFYAYLDFAGGGNPQGICLDFEYNMLADPNVDDMDPTYKIRFELEDQNTDKITLSKEFELDGTDKEFRAGQVIKKTISFSDANIADKIKTFNNYKLSIYAVSGEQKVLLTKRTFPYFYIQWMQLMQ